MIRIPTGQPGLSGFPGQPGYPGLQGPPGIPGPPGISTLPQIVISYIDSKQEGRVLINGTDIPFSQQITLSTPSWGTFTSFTHSWKLDPGIYCITISIQLSVVITQMFNIPPGTYVNLVDLDTSEELGIRQNVTTLSTNLPISITFPYLIYYKYPLEISREIGQRNIVVRYFTTNVNTNVSILSVPESTAQRGTWSIERISI